MNIKKCGNGHFYNADKFPECPHCKEEQAEKNAYSDMPETVAYKAHDTVQSLPPTGEHAARELSQSTAPVSFVQQAYQPNVMQSRGMIVGWLVGVAGPGYGMVHTLYTSDTVIENVVISFDMYSKCFVLNFTLTQTDVMINNRIVVENEYLNYMDRIFINGTEYMLVTLCKDGFSWWHTSAPAAPKPRFTYVEEDYNASLVNAQMNNVQQEDDYEEPATSVLVSNTWRCLSCNAENTEMVTVCRLCNSPRGYYA